MWRSLRFAAPKNNVTSNIFKPPRCLFATSPPHSGGGKKTIITFIAVAGIGVGGAVAYGKYDPKFRKLVEDNIPYSELIFKSVPDWEPSTDLAPKEAISNQKVKDPTIESGLLKKKQDRLKQEQKLAVVPEQMTRTSAKLLEDKKSEPEPEIVAKSGVDNKSIKQSLIDPEISVTKEITAIENSIKGLLEKLEKSSIGAIHAQEAASEAVQLYANKLYLALDVPEGSEGDELWKQANVASSSKSSALNMATQKTSEARAIIEKLEQEIKKGYENNESSKSPILVASEETLNKVTKQLQTAESKVTKALAEAKTASDYKELVNKGREQFRNELKIVLPKYVHKNKEQSMTEDELNLLIAHAHRRIEQLQKQLARQQITEKHKVDEAVRLQKSEDEQLTDSQISVEVAKQQKELELGFLKRVAVMRDDFEAEMRQQLRRQAAAHADHLQEVLQVQHQELERKFNLDLEEKILHQKGVFISEISESMSRLKGIESFLRAKAQLDEAAKKAQALWLACQAMKSAIKVNKSGEPNPLAKELAAVKEAAGEDSAFVTTLLAGIPSEAVRRGVFTDELLKQRFLNVKRVCRRVAMIDDKGASLYRYFLSYLQSFLILDATIIPKAELEGKVAVDPSEWDTFDILSRVSYCLQSDDMEQALRYANQLKGEPRNVAKDWILEVKLLLETRQAVDSLIAHASAVGVQAYH